ncbi:hypothetical protein [Actinocrispum sp. NPDC049592]|uniref:hypothetical protein n=1 Tax=Actinocrispum sp. NPDC049592 TaxID=3154835 RepID=UPI003440B8A9
MNIKQMAEERRSRKQSEPAPAGTQRGKCLGVYSISSRKVARVLLASGLVVTAYLTVNAPEPAVNSNVLVSAPVPCPDQPANGGGCGLIAE